MSFTNKRKVGEGTLVFFPCAIYETTAEYNGWELHGFFLLVDSDQLSFVFEVKRVNDTL